MAEENKHIQHVKSNVVNNGKPKLPDASILRDGEIAVNYAKGVETISLKNTNNEIVTFSSDDYYTEQKLGSDFTGENSGNTVTDSIHYLSDVVIGVDEVPEFDSTKQYSKDDIVLYNETLYRFITAHSGAWNLNDVVETDLVSEIDRMVKSDYERAVIILKTESDTPLANVEVSVSVEGEESSRTLTTDANGKCETNVAKGLEYTVSCNNIEGYEPVDTVIRRASLPTRYIEFTYIEEETQTHEIVKIILNYANESLPKATWVKVFYDGEDHLLTVDNEDVVQTSIEFGTTYTVSFEAIEGYVTPRTRTYIAEAHGTRPITVRYNSTLDRYAWLMADGSEKDINKVTMEDKDNGEIFGVIVRSSDLTEKASNFVVPIDYLLRSSAPLSGNYLNANEEVPLLNYGSHASALNESNIEGINLGKYNCDIILKYIKEKKEQGITRSSTIAQSTYGLTGGYPQFVNTLSYSAGRYVKYDNKIYQFSQDHIAKEWDGTDVTLVYDTFDSTKAYAIGDKVVYTDGILYEFIETHIADNPWSSTEVEKAGWLMPDIGQNIKHTAHCFTPAYVQLYRMNENRTDLDAVTYDLFAMHVLNIGSGYWWSSTQYNAIYGVRLYNGGFFYDDKYTNSNVLPVLAY